MAINEKRYTAKQAAEAVLAKTHELLQKHEHIGWGKLHGKLKREGYSEESADKIAGSIKAKVEKAETGHEKGVHTKSPHFAQGSVAGNKLAVWPKKDAASGQIMAKLVSQAHDAAKDEHKRVLGEMKQMPKPNLGKAENSGKENAKPSEHGAKEEDQQKHGKGPKGEMNPVQPQEAPKDGIAAQPAPDNNPKEQAEGNNELAGTTPTQVGQDGKNIPGGDEIKGHLKLAKFCGYMEAKRKMRSKAGI